MHEIDNEKIMKEMKVLNKQRASQKSDISINVMKDNADIFADYLFETVRSAIKISNFPNCLKLAGIILYKKGRKHNKENYIPVSIPPILSKIFGRIPFEQM